MTSRSSVATARTRSVLVRLEPVVHDLDRLDALFTVNGDGRDAEAKAHGTWLAGGLAGREVAEDLDVALHEVRARLELRLARRVEDELVRVDEDVRSGELAKLAESVDVQDA